MAKDEATKKKTTTTKKSNTTKKNSSKKVVKKEVEKVEVKEVKKESKIKKVFGSILNGLKKFFNNPAPIIIVLIAICCILLLSINSLSKKNGIYVGFVNEGDVAVSNVHFFTNGDMNYFYATNAAYLDEDVKVYGFEIGYYVVDKDGKYISLATRSNKLDNASSLSEIVTEMSGWAFAEADSSDYRFTKEVIDNIDNLHFIIRATTKKDDSNAEINIDHKVELSKITK